MAKILKVRKTVVVELNDEEIQSLFNLLDLFYTEENYKKWAGQLQGLKAELREYAEPEPPF